MKMNISWKKIRAATFNLAILALTSLFISAVAIKSTIRSISLEKQASLMRNEKEDSVVYITEDIFEEVMRRVVNSCTLGFYDLPRLAAESWAQFSKDCYTEERKCIEKSESFEKER
jgi:hypothetical protein